MGVLVVEPVTDRPASGHPEQRLIRRQRVGVAHGMAARLQKVAGLPPHGLVLRARPECAHRIRWARLVARTRTDSTPNSMSSRQSRALSSGDHPVCRCSNTRMAVEVLGIGSQECADGSQ